ncbi:type II 3-dehydroquinate dehydratase [Shumkonia mesophila]|uniref:type II 3-dehydroquinate dehydratase n=1 Tax=Shumkonia mesophila TaxID=2838854 RepID=UPI00293448F3|nr:type II 3-dehydroquinate dehydratase [Shumkonia mesophila]
MATSILLLNGPNLNLLGTRQPEIYGRETLADVEKRCVEHGRKLGLKVVCRQSNSEGELVTWVQQARGKFAGIVLNAGAYTHTSVALMDAISSAEMAVIEVHLSNIHQRETFRHLSYISKVSVGMICGLGSQGYDLALEAFAKRLKAKPAK